MIIRDYKIGMSIDMFNDGKDTLEYLRRYKEKALADYLEQKYKEWLKGDLP